MIPGAAVKLLWNQPALSINLSGNTEFLNEYFIPDLTSIRGQVEITLGPLNVTVPQDMTSMLLAD